MALLDLLVKDPQALPERLEQLVPLVVLRAKLESLVKPVTKASLEAPAKPE
jgi:hypothetical protein